jgi:hypothetical protein
VSSAEYRLDRVRPGEDQVRLGRRGIAAGPDGDLWFTNNRSSSIGRITTSDSVSPTQGPVGTALMIAGAGFTAGEVVTVSYHTGSGAATLCTATAAGAGRFTCTATVPASAGNAGTHAINATGGPLAPRGETVFLLTS